jgi:hypothetical protein
LGAPPDQLEDPVVWSHKPPSIGAHDQRFSRAPYARVNDGEKDVVGMEDIGISGYEIGCKVRSKRRKIGEEVHDPDPGSQAGEASLHLTRVRTRQAEICRQKDHWISVAVTHQPA